MPAEEIKLAGTDASSRTLLLIAASRGLGLAMAAAFLGRGWHVVATMRAGSEPTPLLSLRDRYPGLLEVETLDICDGGQLQALRQKLHGRAPDMLFDMLFVNAGTTTREEMVTIGEVSTDEFVRVMATNALCPMRVVESLQELVRVDGLIGVMSSGQGSVTNNTNGLREVYRSSKAALNQLMRSFAARQGESPRPMVLLAPGWVQTDLGGPNARLTIEESIPNVVNVLLAKQARPGLEYLDYLGRTVPW